MEHAPDRSGKREPLVSAMVLFERFFSFAVAMRKERFGRRRRAGVGPRSGKN
jgi:hypothetical protein